MLVGTLKGLAILTGWDVRDPNSAVRRYQPVEWHRMRDCNSSNPCSRSINSATGFPVKDVQTAEHALFEDSKGILWIATGSDKTGLVRFDRKALRRDEQPLQVQLLNVSLNNEPVCWYDLGDAGADSATVAQQEVRTFGRSLTASERNDTRSKYKGVRFTGIAHALPAAGRPGAQLRQQPHRLRVRGHRDRATRSGGIPIHARRLRPALEPGDARDQRQLRQHPRGRLHLQGEGEEPGRRMERAHRIPVPRAAADPPHLVGHRALRAGGRGRMCCSMSAGAPRR